MPINKSNIKYLSVEIESHFKKRNITKKDIKEAVKWAKDSCR